MSVVDSQALKQKLRAVARKSTSKPPRLWINGKSSPSMADDSGTETSSPVVSSSHRNIFSDSDKNGDKSIDEPNSLTNNIDEKTNGEKDCANGVNKNLDNSDIVSCVEDEVLDNGVQSVTDTEMKTPEEPNSSQLSAEEDDNLLVLSDNKTMDINDSATKNTEEMKPVAMGVKVRNSVRDIVSKLVQDASPEVNKILSRPKNEEPGRDSGTVSQKSLTESKSESKTMSGKPLKENLFEIMSAESDQEQLVNSPKSSKKNDSEVLNKIGTEQQDLFYDPSSSTTLADIKAQDNVITPPHMGDLDPVTLTSETTYTISGNANNNTKSYTETSFDNNSDNISESLEASFGNRSIASFGNHGNSLVGSFGNHGKISVASFDADSIEGKSEIFSKTVSEFNDDSQSKYSNISDVDDEVNQSEDILNMEIDNIGDDNIEDSDSKLESEVSNKSPSKLISQVVDPTVSEKKSKFNSQIVKPSVCEGISNSEFQTMSKADHSEIIKLDYSVKDEDSDPCSVISKKEIVNLTSSLVDSDTTSECTSVLNSSLVSQESKSSDVTKVGETTHLEDSKVLDLGDFDFDGLSDDDSRNSALGKIDIDKICSLNDDSKNGVSDEVKEADGNGEKSESEQEKKIVQKTETESKIVEKTETKTKIVLRNEKDTKIVLKQEDEGKPYVKSEAKLMLKDEIKKEVTDNGCSVKCEDTKTTDMKTEKKEVKYKMDSNDASVSDADKSPKTENSDLSVKPETKKTEATMAAENSENEIQSTKVEIATDKIAVTSESLKERKRSINSPNADSQVPPKRSRLDIMIGKLGDQIGIPPETVPDAIDCDSESEEEESRDESDDISEVKSDDDSSKSDDTKTAEEDDDTKNSFAEEEKKISSVDVKNSESVTLSSDKKTKDGVETTSDKDDVMLLKIDSAKTADGKSKEKSTEVSMVIDDDDDVTVIEDLPEKKLNPKKEIYYETNLDLQQFIKEKVLQMFKTYRNEKIEDLEKRIAALNEVNEKWKATAKELQKQVVDLTVIQHRLDKRKAATAALKMITSRTIGCQVDTTKVHSTDAAGQNITKSPPKASMLSQNQFTFSSVPIQTVTTPNMVSMIKRPNITPVQVNNMSQLLSATAVSRTSASSMNTSISTSTRQTVPINTSVRNLLETSGKNAKTASAPQVKTAPSGSQVLKQLNRNVTSTVTGTKVIDLTADEDANKKITSPKGNPQVTMVPMSALPPSSLGQTILRPLTSGSTIPPGASILLSGPTGTQIVNQTSFNRMAATGNLQVMQVSGGTASGIRPGSLLTVVPSTTAGASTVYPQSVAFSTTATSSKPIVLDTTKLRHSVPPLQTSVVPLTNSTVVPQKTIINTPFVKHPAPLPPQPVNKTPAGGVKGLVPPRPDLKISRVSQGIVLSWTITQNLSLYSEIASYQLFAYQEGNSPPSSTLWKKVGDVKALPLPMACTLTQFQEGNKYHFAVRAVDVYTRVSEFSEPSSIHLFPKSS